MEDVVKRLAGVDLNLLVSLHTLLRLRNVTAAARHLGLTQSTVSHQLARLRELLDDPVLVRHGHGMEPTPRVLALAGELARVLNAAHDLVLSPRAFDPSQAEGEVVIATSDRGVLQYGPPLLARLRAEAPGLRLRFAPPMLEEDIGRLDWDVDLAAVSTERPLDPTRALLLAPEHLVGVARADHPFCLSPPDPAAFLAARHAVVHSTVVPGAVTAEVSRRLRLDTQCAVALPYWLALPPHLLSSDLVALAPTTVAAGLVETAGLGVFQVPVALPAYVLSVAWSGLRAGDPKIAWLVRVLGELFAAEQVRLRAVGPMPARVG